ncbi:hypothetical protein J31TS4_07230 [Paenibacillus sp. J31TS4]|uniref:tetratricopeptide repeat protein n=1 Tax=Paenibacillus sp. J31TS4 TaxID=2807195 RepID=UPI001AFE230C|nr:tetratricopeptide repeat protein [Paenibacillus sp. J31TS4]GIP37443.1 hypothetical protein J31TS4_07230 [Paenibacillus sp. J31TS4]
MKESGGQEAVQKAYEAILDGDYERAVAWFEAALKADPNNADYRYRLSITLARSGRLEPARGQAESACRLDPDNETYRLHLARITARVLAQEAKEAIETGDAERRAIPALKRALELDPLFVDGYVLLGLAYKENGQTEEAQRTIREALRLDPRHPDAVRLWKAFRIGR